MRTSSSIAIGLAVALCAGTAGALVSATTHLVSGVLEARRPATFTCVVINKSGSPVDDIAISLKRPDGTTIVGPEECDGVPHGAACSVTYDVAFPDLDLAAYCHAEVPNHKFLVGNLRFEDQMSNTQAESPLRGNVYGKIQYLIHKVDWMIGDHIEW
jgi:hypothetical protein